MRDPTKVKLEGAKVIDPRAPHNWPAGWELKPARTGSGAVLTQEQESASSNPLAGSGGAPPSGRIAEPSTPE
ncbi:hypothetical protein GCM10023194_47220 [Planotetraspora phitsanulokensis]|uniref:Uncharacterized protein n=1 Tax=Planotetraspora phitsanulokensis TaxID=575192 RepID=A0A8J3UJ03_9ACTN|nr:hypothetical protein Pph01_81870 [Planotetraspora phitsanulokensis]